MPRLIPEDELNAIVTAVSQIAGRAAIDEIATRLEQKLPRRTLQYRVARLVNQKRLVPEGAGRGRYYRLAALDSKATTIPVPGVRSRGEVYVPISPAGKNIKDAVHLPIQERQPVGYRREFLDAYHPNKTFYLPEDIRRQLLEQGESSVEERPAGTYARQILDRLLIDLSWNSSRLEGNTYSLLETERLLEWGENADGKDAREAQMILNHKAAIELLAEHTAEIGFNRYTILNLHALLADNLLDDPQAGGRLRATTVEISGAVYHPLNVPQIVEECFQQIIDTAAAIRDPLEQAFFAMVHLPYLQPFDDVNKRVSRLAANIPLIHANLCPLSFIDVPERAYIDGLLGIYELNQIELLRDVFIWAYKRSCARYSAVRHTIGEPDPFRLHYRALIAELVVAIVGGAMNKQSAAGFIKHSADAKIPSAERARFIEVVETELGSLHEGNIARYRIRPLEYLAWQEVWR